MAETRTYNHSEIQRYLQHKMSPQEMHEFEKALMNDPFLADAMEGFSAANAALAEEHLLEIENAVLGNKQKAKVVPLSAKKTAWWKVAAIILVIISAGTITYSVINSDSAFNKNRSEIAASTPAPATIEKDSIRPENAPVARLEGLPEKKAVTYQKNTSPIIQQDGSRMVGNTIDAKENRDRLVEKPQQDNEMTASLAQAPAPLTTQTASARLVNVPGAVGQNEFRGKVVDKSGEPLPYVAIKGNASGPGTVSDANGNFNLKAADSVLEVNIVSPGYAAAVTKLRSSKPDNKIVLEDNKLSLSETVVSQQLKKKKNMMASVQVDSSVAAEPEGGWRSFKQYLNQQLDSLKSSDDNQFFNEDIVLEFSIDKKGHPTNIKTPAEVDKIMAEKAKQILTNGPRWKNKKKDKKVKVIIAF
jgi:hypothetical protein